MGSIYIYTHGYIDGILVIIFLWGGSISGGTPNGEFITENPFKMDENWGYPHLWKPSYVMISIYLVVSSPITS